MTTLKEWMDAKWQAKGLINVGKRNVFIANERGGLKHIRAGSTPTYKSKEQKAYEARFQLYNDKLRPVILAQATIEMRRAAVNIYDDKGRYISTKQDGQLPHYTWPKEADAAPMQQEQVAPVPRKRVPKAKLEQAAAILAKVPQDELATFLARFGLSMSLAASIASLDNIEQIARQFLRATL